MKKLLLVASLGLAFVATPALAQYTQVSSLNAGRNPGALNEDEEYPVDGGVLTGWATLFAGSTASFSTPVWSQSAGIPFSFYFNGQAVTSYKVSSSGVLTFTTSATAVPGATNTALPSPQIPDKSVCVWGLGATTGDFIITKTFGAAPNRQHWVQFNSYSKPGNTSLFTYWSIVLEETTNHIYIVDQRTSATTGLDITAGVQVNATTALQVAGSPTLESRTAGSPLVLDNSYWSFLSAPLSTAKTQGGQSFVLAPNPAAGRTALHFSLPRPETVQVELLDALGRSVPVAVPGTLGSGSHALPLPLAGQAAGLYLVRLTTSEGVSTRRLVLE
ncbi:T9SS type A sorting domain-containing protein [Hymenobacter psychrotolerans]|uniref:Por secretion system C-terminal sorting domain-containing protein n=1 Tax=Hymenobacter psychrotolerans DSM 18569 TaxID=1121959 RepID=A0A1M7DWT1_9BACT|nr:T9SS type A sorting domain-containing protein [Hymenobacter psychrotolerans]SHL83971.1 Por secretion system C-terminal sorting domain-containing protein [Hymenobacter psychrotolerans DSM 18569]